MIYESVYISGYLNQSQAHKLIPLSYMRTCPRIKTTCEHESLIATIIRRN